MSGAAAELSDLDDGDSHGSLGGEEEGGKEEYVEEEEEEEAKPKSNGTRMADGVMDRISKSAEDMSLDNSSKVNDKAMELEMEIVQQFKHHITGGKFSTPTIAKIDGFRVMGDKPGSPFKNPPGTVAAYSPVSWGYQTKDGVVYLSFIAISGVDLDMSPRPPTTANGALNRYASLTT
jgi:hypothetical protein